MGRWQRPPAWTVSGWIGTPMPWEPRPEAPVLVLFFHTRCAGCVHLALPQAEMMHREYSGRGVRVVGIHSAFEGDGSGVREFLTKGGYTLPVALDAEGDSWKPRTMEAWEVEGTPTLVLLDKRGQLRLRKLGHIEDERLREALEQLLSE